MLKSDEFIEHHMQVLLIDWSEGSQTINYIGAANRVPSIGEFVASYLDFLHANGYMQFDRTTVIGFSLGAHIAGMTGKNVRRGRIANIVGLDPAGPLFSVRNPEGRLDAADAEFVEVIHTNGPTLLVAGAGIGYPVGHVDFWPNGGRNQPGCFTNTCSHLRAVQLYVESIHNNRFEAFKCLDRDDINPKRCIIPPAVWMGGDSINSGEGISGAQGQARQS
jgi:pimeloyl-ACP methyl ester carboxylesterase